VRRLLYEFVAEHPSGASRDEAAAAVGVSRKLAAFHLDHLAGAGLLEVDYRRLSGRKGPGAGRPSKIYRRAPKEFGLSLPPRDYELPAQILAAAVEEGRAGRPVDPEAVAYAAGVATGRRARQARAGERIDVRELQDALRAHGYEPFVDADGALRLRNCPFHLLAADHPDLVCGMNQALISGMVEGLGVESGARAELDPRPPLCCVAIRLLAS
jgi:predicted ArsR family transcriptional regulator